MALAKFYEDIIEKKFESMQKGFKSASKDNEIKKIDLEVANLKLETLKDIILKEISDFINPYDNSSVELIEAKVRLRDKNFEIKGLNSLKEKREKRILDLAGKCDYMEKDLLEAEERIKYLEKRNKMLKKKLKKHTK